MELKINQSKIAEKEFHMYVELSSYKAKIISKWKLGKISFEKANRLICKHREWMGQLNNLIGS